jgi:hypothetical protein
LADFGINGREVQLLEFAVHVDEYVYLLMGLFVYGAQKYETPLGTHRAGFLFPKQPYLVRCAGTGE